MGNRFLTLGLVVLAGIVLGVAVVVPATKNQTAEQQFLLLMAAQGRIEDRLGKIEEKQQEMMTIYQQAKDTANKVQQQIQAQPPADDSNKVYTIPVDHSYVRGPKNAKVTIVEFVDFQCPFCARFYPPVLEALKAYPNDVNYIIKNFPLSFHPNAKPAAKAALAAGEQGKYYEMVDGLLENFQNLNEDLYKDLAKKIGLNVDRFLKDYKEKDAQWEDLINKDIALGGAVNVNGTPTFYMNGKKTTARDFAALKTEIDGILQKK